MRSERGKEREGMKHENHKRERGRVVEKVEEEVYLQQLRLAGARVSTQENIDISSEAAVARVVEVFPRTSKQLQQNTLLDVIILIDTGSWGGGEGGEEGR